LPADRRDRFGVRARPGAHVALVAGALLAVASLARAAAVTPGLPLALFGDESVAASDDARAYLFNPAAIGQRYPSELLVAWARRDEHREWNTGVATMRRIALGFTRQRDTSQTYGIGFSTGGERMRFGWASYWLVAGQPRRERDLDDRAGLLFRPTPWLSTAAVVAHAFQPEFRGIRLPREYTLGVGLRPLALSRPAAHTLGTRLTLTGDVILVEDGEWRQSRVRVGASLEPIRGVELRATAEDHRSLELGIALRGARGRLSVAQARVDGDRAYESYAVSSHAGEDAGLVVPRSAQRVAVVGMGGVLADESLSGGLLGGGGSTPSGPLHAQLERALADPLTRGVLLELSGVAGMAQLEELRPRIGKLEQLGKPVVAFMQYGGSRGDLYMASAASRAYASPAAEFMGLGLRSERRYYRRALERLGVRMERASVGEFKSAYRNLSVDSTPPADTTVIQRMLTQRQDLFVNTVATSRAIAPERLLPVLDGREYQARSLARLGVIDSVGWREDALAELGRLCGLGKKPRTVDLRRAPEARVRWATPAPIAVVYAGGAIVNGRSGLDALDGAVMGDQTLTAQLERAFHAPGVRAVVLRIESPGGSAAASYLMDHAVERLKRETGKPLVVSMGSVAASGGYFMSVHADRIFADKHTITGSIGVLFVKPSFEGAYEKLGVRQDDFERGDYMRGLSFSRDWRPREKAAADSSVKRLYRTFLERVIDGRKMEPYEASAFAQGRAWMGEDAAEHKLVDGIGGLEAAIGEARRLAGVPAGEKIALLEFRRPRGTLFERVIGGRIRSEIAATFRMPDWDAAQARAEDWVEDLAE
jgi:protease-4